MTFGDGKARCVSYWDAYPLYLPGDDTLWADATCTTTPLVAPDTPRCGHPLQERIVKIQWPQCGPLKATGLYAFGPAYTGPVFYKVSGSCSADPSPVGPYYELGDPLDPGSLYAEVLERTL
jgi:hypothetical protein